MNTLTNEKAVQAALLNAGMSVETLAGKAGISKATAYRVAKGTRKVAPETIKAVADVLGVEPASLAK